MSKEEYKVLCYYYPRNILEYTYPIKDKRRIKVWTIEKIDLITDVEFNLGYDELKIGRCERDLFEGCKS